MAGRSWCSHKPMKVSSAGVDMLLISDTRPGERPGAADRVLHALRGALSEGKLSPFLLERALIRLHRFRARVEGS